MRVLIDATTTQNEWRSNGIGFYTRNIVSNLVTQFSDTKFILLMYDNPSEIEGLLSSNLENLEVVRIGGFKKKNLFNPIWYLNQLLPGIDMLKTLKRVYKEGDLFFSPFFWGGIPSSIPFVVTIHDLAFPRFNIYSQISFLHNIARGVTYWIEMFKTLKAKAIITDAQFTIDEYLHYLPKYPREKMFPIYLGLDIELVEKDVNRLLPQDWREKGYIINLGGGYTKNKNTGGIIDAYAKYVEVCKGKNKVPPYLVIAGKNFQDRSIKDVRNLHRKINSLGIEGLVHFPGRYEDDDRYSLLKNSLLTINLSAYEGFGIALLEGMKAGAPTIASNASCYPEVVKDGAHVVDAGNIDSVVQAIEKIIEDRKYAESLSEKGKVIASSYSWEKAAEETYNVLSKSLNN
ncbi:glycosyltransferase family 4 protein [Candidatus Dojkabacteria bacterium]|nr:glycosyltransferase family 4 protein [Candidatus Dojkabacteria bacterium]